MEEIVKRLWNRDESAIHTMEIEYGPLCRHVIYFLAFGGLYSAAMLWINRNRKQTLLIDHENGA